MGDPLDTDSNDALTDPPINVSRRHVTRKFLGDEIIKKIEEFSEKMNVKEIADSLGLSFRQVRNQINMIKRGQTNSFSEAEDNKIIWCLFHGIVKESVISKYFINKAPWMVRNRIKLLKNNGRIYCGCNDKSGNDNRNEKCTDYQFFDSSFSGPDQYYL